MGMDCNGSLALLAGRRHSALVQLHWDSHNTLGEKLTVSLWTRTRDEPTVWGVR